MRIKIGRYFYLARNKILRIRWNILNSSFFFFFFKWRSHYFQCIVMINVKAENIDLNEHWEWSAVVNISAKIKTSSTEAAKYKWTVNRSRVLFMKIFSSLDPHLKASPEKNLKPTGRRWNVEKHIDKEWYTITDSWPRGPDGWSLQTEEWCTILPLGSFT